MKPIPFFDLKEQNKFLQKQLENVFKRVTANTAFILGDEVEKFEKNFAKYTGCRYAVGVNSGLDALSLALRAMGIGPGDEVLVPANSFIASSLAVDSVGAVPVFVDAEPDNLLLDMDSVKKALSKKTRAVMPVHLYGQPVDMPPLLDFCRKKALQVIEDACQAHGASIHGKKCGTFGRASAFSFYPGKNLGAFGDGGMVTTDDKALYEKLQLLRNYGSVVKYVHPVRGFNTRLDALQAAILDVKLRYLDRWNSQREILARHYDSVLSGIEGVQLLKARDHFSNARHLYVIRTAGRDELQEFLTENAIGTGIHYPAPIHAQGAYKNRRVLKNRLPVSEKDAKRVLSLPMYPEMSLEDVDAVCQTIRDFFEK